MNGTRPLSMSSAASSGTVHDGGTHLPPSVWSERLTGAGPVTLLCDHASRVIPPGYGDLGLAPDDRDRHFVWDPGAWDLACRLSAALDAPLVGAGVSRLIVDCNRNADDEDLIVAVGELTPIPGNREVSYSERANRLKLWHTPFHATIAAHLDGRPQDEALVSVHSFTPVFKGVTRPWHVGVLFDRNDGFARHIVRHLSAEPGLIVAENQPYSPSDRVYRTLDRHGDRRGKPTAMLEIRNDLLATPEGIADWTHRLQGALRAALAGWKAAAPA